MKKTRFFGKWIMVLIAAVFTAYFLLPTILTFTNSFMSETEIGVNYGPVFSVNSGGFISDTVHMKLIPEEFTLQQYNAGLIQSKDYLMKFWNSVLYVVPIVLFQLIVASTAAYSFMRWHGKIRKVIFFLYIILMLMPYQVTLVPNYLISKWLDILNTRKAIILPGVFAPFSVFLLTRFMRRIPYALIEAAKLDGANEWQIFTRIILPQCRGPLISVAILVFIDYWNMVEQPLVLLSDAEMYPLSVFLSYINNSEVGIAFALATLYMIPPILLFLWGEKYLIEGIISSGSVKG